MGFMDKAKQLAEQAQQKLDEAQKNFNQGGSPQAPAEGGVRYDEHGRPVQDAPPAGEAAPTPEPAPGEAPASESPAESPAADEPAPTPPPTGGANASPDPFKPIDQ
jgi:hypothetical protein